MIEHEKYEKRGIKLRCLKNIQKLMESNLFSKALKECEYFLGQYGEDCEVLYYYGKCVNKLGNYIGAIEIYKRLLAFQQEDGTDHYRNATLVELFKLYFNYDHYKEAYKIFPIIKEDLGRIYGCDVNIYEEIFKVKLGIPVDINEYTSPVICKLVNYDENMAIRHISMHLHEVENKRKHSIFEDVDIEKLFYNIKNILPESKKFERLETNDLYLFYFPHIGKDNIDTILVVTNKGTNEIISIYPQKTEYDEFVNYNLHELYLNKEPEKVKKISQIDKFNKRYNIENKD